MPKKIISHTQPHLSRVDRTGSQIQRADWDQDQMSETILPPEDFLEIPYTKLARESRQQKKVQRFLAMISTFRSNRYPTIQLGFGVSSHNRQYFQSKIG